MSNENQEAQNEFEAAAAARNAEIADAVSKYDDSRRPLASAAKYGAMALAAMTVLSLAIWGGAKGMPGVWSVLLGALIGGGFVLLTVATVYMTAKTTPQMTGAIVLGGWILKVVVLIVILLIIRDLTFYDPVALFVTVVLALVVTLGAEVWGMAQENLTYTGSR